jgi:hypothetical protein
LPWFEFESEKFQWYYLYLSCVENRVCLSHGVHVVGAAWRAAMKIIAGVGDLLQKIGDGQAHVGYSVARRSGGRVTLCAVYIIHKETRCEGFLVWPQNQGRWFAVVWPQNHWVGYPGLGLKTGSYDLVI